MRYAPHTSGVNKRYDASDIEVLAGYLREALAGEDCIPRDPHTGSLEGPHEAVDWAFVWLPEDAGGGITESYVNLVPTPQGGTHVNGLRQGLADADSDGRHIATLLCALFVRHFRPMVEAGHVYVAMPPLYRIDVGNED